MPINWDKVGKFAETFGPFIPGIGSLVAGGVNLFANAMTNRRARKYEREMAEYTYSKDLEMWNKQNEYNSPRMQMQRFFDAGLNPKLIYGQGSSGNAPSMPHYQDIRGTFGTPFLHFANAVDAYQNFALKKAQIDNVKQNTAVQEKNEALIDARQVFANMQNTIYFPIDFKKTFPEYFDKGYRSIMETQLEANKLRNDQVASMLWWQQYKNEQMRKSQINIDTDNIMWRNISDVFGDVLNHYKTKLRKSMFNKLVN